VLPLVAGVLIALLVPRLEPARARSIAAAVLSVAVAIMATLIAGEAWYFVVLDLGLVLLALGVTTVVVKWLRHQQVDSRQTT
jgi:peptidoglycan/LPS O-acetylase OafA/YrhL